jgi:hypothetical protein
MRPLDRLDVFVLALRQLSGECLDSVVQAQEILPLG